MEQLSKDTGATDNHRNRFGWRLAELVVGIVVGLLTAGFAVSTLISHVQEEAIRLGKASQKIEDVENQLSVLENEGRQLKATQATLSSKTNAMADRIQDFEKSDLSKTAELVLALEASPSTEKLLERVSALDQQLAAQAKGRLEQIEVRRCDRNVTKTCECKRGELAISAGGDGPASQNVRTVFPASDGESGKSPWKWVIECDPDNRPCDYAYVLCARFSGFGRQ